jgi:hypothetical protein
MRRSNVVECCDASVRSIHIICFVGPTRKVKPLGSSELYYVSHSLKVDGVRFTLSSYIDIVIASIWYVFLLYARSIWRIAPEARA